MTAESLDDDERGRKRYSEEGRTTGNRTVVSRIKRRELLCDRCPPHRGCNSKRRKPKRDKSKEYEHDSIRARVS